MFRSTSHVYDRFLSSEQRRRPLRTVVALFALVCSLLVTVPAPQVGAQPNGPSVGETARLLGYLWADGSYSNGVWDATGPSGGSTLIEYLVEAHGGTWVDRTQLRFTLPQPYDWVEWKDGLPDNDSRTRQAVEHPHFLAALLEGEGSTAGLVYDQSSCCTAGFLGGRLTDLLALLKTSGFITARLTQFGDADSGEVTIASSEFAELRAAHEFVCPAMGSAIRVPGAENYGRFGSIRWFGPATDFETVVRRDCRVGVAISAASPPVGDCVVTVDGGGRLRVSWTYPRGTIAIRRNGAFVKTVSALERTFVEARPAGSNGYEIRINVDGSRSDDLCGVANSSDPAQIPPPGEILCMGAIITHMGTGGDDIIDGTSGPDVLHGFGGNDLLRGFGRNDFVCGGPGNDRIRGGYGDDRIFGGDGSDRINSGPGADRSRGGNGADWLEGNRGPDVLDGGGGNDVLRGGAGFDTLLGGRGRDILRGGPHIDACTGGWGVDRLANDCEHKTQ